jgi:mannose-6-phosphate isomerase-like protein (cupin superfamily)
MSQYHSTLKTTTLFERIKNGIHEFKPSSYVEIHECSEKSFTVYSDEYYMHDIIYVILQGSMIVTKNGKQYLLDRNGSLTIKSHTVFSTYIREGGCKFLILENQE